MSVPRLLTFPAIASSVLACCLTLPGCTGSKTEAKSAPSNDPSEQEANSSKETTDEVVSLDQATETLQQLVTEPFDQADRGRIEKAIQVYLIHAPELPDELRTHAVKRLIELNDPSTSRALIFSLDTMHGDDKTQTRDARLVLSAYQTGQLEFLADALFEDFLMFRAHTQAGGITYKTLNQALVSHPRKEWAPKLLSLLDAPLFHPARAKSLEEKRAAIDPYRDQLFWQVSAAQLLGELRYADAVEPLIETIGDPSKGDVATTALLALTKIGAPAVERAARLFDENDPLAAKANALFSAHNPSAPKQNIATAQAAAIIGMVGRSEGIAPMLLALKQTRGTDAALIARELPKLPRDSKTVAAFKRTFERLDLKEELLGTPVLLLLAESSAKFYEPKMVDWLLKQAERAKGRPEVVLALQQALVTNAIKIATRDQWSQVETAARKYKVEHLASLIAPLVQACDDVSCYLDQAAKPENGTPKTQFIGIKAAYMVGVLGDASARDALVERLPSFENDAVHFAALGAIDVLSPKAAPKVVEDLEALIEKNEKSDDPGKLSKNSPLKQIAYRISVR